MKKLFFALAFAGLTLSASAQRASDAAFGSDFKNYNRIGVSYNNTNYKANYEFLSSKSMGVNGFGIDYIHGFHITNNLPLFLETGINFNMGFASDSESGESGRNYWKDSFKFQDMNLQVPVNVAWQFNVGGNFKISPYLGLNFKLHLLSRFKDKYEDEDGVEEGDWYSVFDDGEDAMGDKDDTWNRFQMGWHVGVGFTYQPFYLGVQYGTDFIKAYSHKFDDGKSKIDTGNLKVVVAYTF